MGSSREQTLSIACRLLAARKLGLEQSIDGDGDGGGVRYERLARVLSVCFSLEIQQGL